MILLTKSSKKMQLTIKFSGDILTKSIVNDLVYEGHLLKIDEQNNE